jgi:hypothetical protein
MKTILLLFSLSIFASLSGCAGTRGHETDKAAAAVNKVGGDVDQASVAANTTGKHLQSAIQHDQNQDATMKKISDELDELKGMLQE